MKSVRVEQAKGPFKLFDEKIVEPARGQVRIKVQACGVCHSDEFTKEGAWPGITYPRSPGHEIAGVIEALGEDAGEWKAGDRVGVGWHGGNCFRCEPCRRGDFINCKFLKIPGISYDGGYSAHVIAPVEALAHIPDVLRPEEVAPLMCAGITTFNALRHSGAGRATSWVSRGSADSGIWESSLRPNLVTTSSRSDAAKTSRRWR